MPVLIKRYANRKLYNTQTSRYITLKGIAELVEAGEEIRVMDNESGDDITSVTLSQVLVDSERNQRTVPGTLLSELITRGGDVLYNALRKGVGDASGGINELQRNVRRLITPREREAGGEGGERDSEWLALSTPELELVVTHAVQRALAEVDLPRRGDIEALARNLERVVNALEALHRLDRSVEKTGEAPRPATEPS